MTTHPARRRWRLALLVPVFALVAALHPVLLRAAWPVEAAAPAVVGEPGRFGWPLSPRPRVVRGYQAPATPYGPGHRGVDLAAAEGQQVLSAGPGVVVFAGQVAGRGVLSVDHDGGLRTTYEPVSPAVAAGDQVHLGQSIGAVVPGHPECPEPVCLHWGVRRGEEYLDPLPLVQVEFVLRLKPWDGSGGDAY
ncbi:M23 family metallopeptidase [Amycolatopsis suaedae]|uniref:M23 family metallopeptidase n=1 Tax=Amycolatopsis suaedae TaxID=2510978 RepID=UPI003B833C4F